MRAVPLLERTAFLASLEQDAEEARGGEATLALLRCLGRRLRGLPVLLIATFRDDGLAPDHPLRVVLGFLASLRTTRRLALPGLSESAVDELAAASPVAPEELFRLTG